MIQPLNIEEIRREYVDSPLGPKGIYNTTEDTTEKSLKLLANKINELVEAYNKIQGNVAEPYVINTVADPANKWKTCPHCGWHYISHHMCTQDPNATFTSLSKGI